MKSFLRVFTLAVAATSVSVLAQESEDEEDTTIEAADSAEESASSDLPEVKKPEEPKYFHILPFCRELTGAADVKTPKSTEWRPIDEGRFYPLGTVYRTVGRKSHIRISFGKECEVDVDGEGSFATLGQDLGVKGRTIAPLAGTIAIKLPRNLPAGLFTVTAPGFAVTNMQGEATIGYAKNGDGDEATVRCVTGSLAIEGRHFKVPAMRAANEIRIRTSNDGLFTGLYGTSGDYLVKLEQGLIFKRNFATSEDTIEAKTLDWKMSPKAAVRIHRAVPAIGEKMSVSVFTFDPKGNLVNRCAFAEQRPEVNSGELGPVSKAEKEAMAKRAAEAVQTVEAAASETTEAAADAAEATDEGSDAGSSEDADF